MRLTIPLAALLAALALATPPGMAAEPSARVIVSLRADAPAWKRQALAAAGEATRTELQQRADALAAGIGRPLRAGRAVGARGQVVRAEGIDSATLAARLAAHPDVEWAVVDRRRRALLVPNDPLFPQSVRSLGPDAGQWYLRAPDTTIRSAINAQAAWDRVTGRSSVVVAVIDTGVLGSHLDLAGRLLPGIDAVSADPDGSFVSANDGDGEDADASDPGDWITAAEDASGYFAGCGVSDSSWHGTQVASIIGATGNDGIGMAGTAFGVSILPVRVLGKCGGYDSDIIAGMLWAAGLQTVAGIANANPAKVLNMSLGGSGACEASYRDAIARINATGAVVVAAAGNSAGQAVGTPANCPGVIGVAGLRHAGSKVGFSDLGPEIAISAPGGNCVNIGSGEACLYPILSASNRGTSAPLAGGSIWTDSFNISVGTSFASPIVAGTVALMLSVRPTLTPAEIRAALQSSARPFPTSGADNGPGGAPVTTCQPPSGADQLQCYCTTALCGAGMLDAAGAVAAATGLFARIGVVTATPTAGSMVELSGAGSAAATGRSIVGYEWAIVSGGGIVGAFSSATNGVAATLQPTAAGSMTLRLTVTDDLGARASVEQVVSVAAAPVPPPATPPAGGGGGAMGGLWMMLLGLAVAGLGRRRP